MHDCDTCAFVRIHTPWSGFQPIDVNEARRIFHQNCADCARYALEDQLCGDCRHLRLRHLLVCGPQEYNSATGTSIHIPLGMLDDIDRVQNCELHRMLQTAVQIFRAHFKLQDELATSLDFFLWIRHDHTVSFKGSSSAFSQHLQAFTICEPPRNGTNLAHSHIPLPALVDWNRTKSWWKQCEQGHSTCPFIFDLLEDLPDRFRVVDVLKRRLVCPSRSEPCRYVALSYVWGEHPDPTKCTAQRSTIQYYSVENGLPVSNVSAVIEQAMRMCSEMGERFLWVDRLCIVQDDLQDKQDQIKAMDAIFAHAVFTIVIADGDSMDIALSGIDKPRNFTTRSCNIGGLLLRNMLPGFSQTVPMSAWAGRGWTYQERLLSGRKLYISSLQVYWLCSHGLLCEDNSLNSDGWNLVDRSRWARMTTGETLTRYTQEGCCFLTSEEAFGSYTLYASQYNSKKLSYSSDFCNAFAGILTALYPPEGRESTSVYNLPKRDFDAALLWYCSAAVPRRTADRMTIPSWTWSSMFGSVVWLPCYGSLVKWYLVTENQATCLLESSRSVVTNSWCAIAWDELPVYYLALAHHVGCYAKRIDFSTEYIRYPDVSEASERWRDYEQFWHHAFPKDQAHVDFSSFRFPDPKQTYLGTQAQTAHVKLRVHPHHGNRCPRVGTWYNILNQASNPIGLLMPSPTLADPAYRHTFNERSFKVMSISVGDSSDYQCCFLQRSGFESRAELITKFDVGYPPIRQACAPPILPVPTVNVLLHGERYGLSVRLGIGWIFLRRWVELERQVEKVVLC